MIRAARPCGGPILAVGSRVLRADCCALDRVVQYPVRARDALKALQPTRHRTIHTLLSIVGGINKEFDYVHIAYRSEHTGRENSSYTGTPHIVLVRQTTL